MSRELGDGGRQEGGEMTPLRFVLGLLWLAGASAWMLPPPCINLWRAWGYRSARSGAGNGNFAVMGAMKQLCFITSGIVAGLSAFWWEHLYLCLEASLTLLLLGVAAKIPDIVEIKIANL